jgi:hypothetical protein
MTTHNRATGVLFALAITGAWGAVNTSFKLIASDYPHGSAATGYNPVIYNVKPTVTMVALHGGMGVIKEASYSSACPDHVCIASNCLPTTGCACTPHTPTSGECKPIGQWKTIASATVTIPDGHDGRVLMVGKLRCQGDGCDDAMTVRLRLRVNNVIRGSEGVQGLGGQVPPFTTSISQRTMTTSFFCDATNVLLPGTYTVELLGRVDAGNGARIRHLSYHNDLPLLLIFG